MWAGRGILAYIKAGGYIDAQTRAIMIDFSLFVAHDVLQAGCCSLTGSMYFLGQVQPDD